MNEDPKGKPVRELLQDISRSIEPTRATPRSFIDPKLMDRITVFVSVVCLLVVSAIFIGMIWSRIDEAFGFRFAGSVGIFLLTLLAFRAINAQCDWEWPLHRTKPSTPPHELEL